MTTFSQISPSKQINTKIILNESKIIHFIPDFNTNIINYLDKLPFRTDTTLQAIVIKSNIIKLGSIGLNPKGYFVKVKKEFSRTVNIVPDTIQNNKYIIIDHSAIINAIEKISIMSERRALFLLLNYLKNEFQFVKSIHPNIENVALIKFNNNGMYEFLEKNLPSFKSKLEFFNFFDNYTLINVKNTTLPFIYYKSNNIFIDFSALKRIKKEVQEINNDIVNNIPDVQIIEPEIDLNKITYSVLPEDKISSELLNNAIDTFDIKDENVINNVKIVIKQYKNKNSNIDKNELNQVVLKVLNKTIYGNDNISQEELDNPKLLTEKIKLFTEYEDPIVFNNTSTNFMQPTNNIIKINHITGPIRHKHEFSENIHVHVDKLFKTLENKINPIEIKNIKYTIEDNNIDRYIYYTVTLQNKSKGKKEPYDIHLKVPYLINDRYFKLNGKEYILSSQQFLKPITKNTPHESRFLSHYNMITEKLVNFKYAPSDIKGIISYIARNYSKNVKKYKDEDGYIEFTDGSTINLSDPGTPFYHDEKELKFENGKYFLFINENKIDTPLNKDEFLFEHLYKIINTINPSDNLKISMKSIQYVELHIMGAKIPLILVLWQQIGLIESLIKLGINFEILDEYKSRDGSLIFELQDNKFLACYVKIKRDEYILNGLLKADILKNINSNNLNNRESIYSYLVEKHGTKIINNLDGMVENAIDPTTKEILTFYRLPLNILDIITGPLLDKLFNDQPDHPSDLNTLRVRMSEYMTQLMYNEINFVSLCSNT